MIRQRLFFLAVTLALSCLPKSSVNAEKSTRARPSWPPAEAVMEAIAPAFLDALASNDQAKFNKIRFVFPDDPAFDHVRATIDAEGNPVVEVSRGYLHLANELFLSAAIDIKLSPDMDFAKYLSYIKSNLPSDLIVQDETGLTPTYQPFYQWAGIPREKVVALMNEREDLFLKASLEIFVFTIAHEVAHHILGHRRIEDHRHARDEEYAADQWAIAMSHKLKLKTTAILPTLLFLAVIEGDIDSLNASDHDPAVCRYFQLAGDQAELELAELQIAVLKRCERLTKKAEP